MSGPTLPAVPAMSTPAERLHAALAKTFQDLAWKPYSGLDENGACLPGSLTWSSWSTVSPDSPHHEHTVDYAGGDDIVTGWVGHRTAAVIDHASVLGHEQVMARLRAEGVLIQATSPQAKAA